MKTSTAIYSHIANLSRKISHSAKKIVERLKQAYGGISQGELAERFGIAESTISSWKNPDRNRVDYELIIEKIPPDINLHWLFTGEGEMKVIPTEDQFLEKLFYNYEASIDDLDNTGISKDRLFEFYLKQQEHALDFVRKAQSDFLNGS